MKSYYEVIVTNHNNTTFENDLMLSEIHILGTLLKNHKKVEIQRMEITKEHYNLKFGK